MAIKTFLSPSQTFKHTHAHLLPILLALAVLVLSLGVTSWVWQHAQETSSERLKSEFRSETNEMTTRIQQRMSSYEHMLRSTLGFISASDKVRRDEFNIYISSLDLSENYPGMTGIGIAWLVPKDMLEQHIAETRMQGVVDYRILPSGDRQVYAPIVMRYPDGGHNHAAMGYDPYSDPLRRAAMNKASKSGSIAMTTKLLMVTETQNDGLLMYLPIYRNKAIPATLADRQANIAGWVYAAIRTNEMMTALIDDREPDFEFAIYDGVDETDEALLYRSNNDAGSSHYHAVKNVSRIHIGFHTWTIAYRSLPAFETRVSTGKPNSIAETGMTLSLLLALLMYLLAAGRGHALVLANRMTEDLRKSEARYARVIEGSDQGFWDWNLATGEYTVSPRFESMLGYEKGEYKLSSENWKEFIHPDDIGRVLEQLELHAQGQNPLFEIEMRCLTKSGEWKWVHTRGKIVARNDDGKPLIISGSRSDISRRKKAEDELQLASLVYKNSSEAILVTDGAGTIVAINPAFTQLTGYSYEEVVGKQPDVLKSGRHDKEFYEAMWNSLETTGQWQGEIWNRKKTGEIYPAWININSTYNEDGSVYRRVALFSDITKKKALEDLIWQQANFDTLTGLPNRRRFIERLEHELSKHSRNHLPIALIFLDLDYFKEINDTLGHAAGDLLLKIAAERLSSCVRRTDTVARLGGDEFTIILTELTDVSSVNRVAASILDKLSEPFILEGEIAYVSASMGITLFPDDAADSETLLRNADQAMYAAKQQGKNRYSFYDSSLQDAVSERRQLIQYLHDAIEKHHFRLAYQPIVELKTGVIRKAEALLRWQHPEKGMISPSVFIPVAEEIGLINTIGNWVFFEAKQQAAKWRAQYGNEFQVSVNVSPAQFKNEGNESAAWLNSLKDSGLSGHSIVVEITEGLLLDASQKVTDQLLMLRDAGIEVALDDFGTGHSSLSYLKKFDIDYIKIDQSFIQSLTPDSGDLALCEAMIVMAHKLGIKVIAEGIETQEQCDLLTDAGCDFGQGFHFSRPMPGEGLEKLLMEQIDG